VFFGAMMLIAACTPNQRIINSANERPPEPDSVQRSATAAPARIEDDISAMKTADFNFIYIFRRKDGTAMGSDDRSYLSSTIPSEVNRRKISDEGRAVIVGSNFRIPPETMNILKERFAFEDHSKPESEIMPANSNRR
jgi:hypothetical protein